MAPRVALVAAHAGTVLGPVLVLSLFAPTGTGLSALPRTIAAGGPWAVLLVVLAVLQAVVGAILGLRHLRVPTPVGVHVIGPTLIAWTGLGAATLGVASAGDAVAASGGSDLLANWTLSLAEADLPRQLGFLLGGWGWLAALATITLGAFVRRGGAPKKPGLRLALIAAACTLPTVVLLIGGDMVAVRSGLFLIGLALLAGGLLALAAPTVSVWSVSDDPPSKSMAFSTIWLCGCAAVVTVAMQGLALAWQAQSAALVVAATDATRADIATAARAQAELSTELTYLCAGLALAWLTLAMRGRRVVLSAPSHNIGSVLVTLLLATSIGIANNLYEHGASRQHAAVVTSDEPELDELALPAAHLPEPLRLSTVVRVEATTVSLHGATLATLEGGAWRWRDDASIGGSPVALGDAAWQREICSDGDLEVGVAAAGDVTTTHLLTALTGLRAHGICRVQLVARHAALTWEGGMLSPWISALVSARERQLYGLSLFLSPALPDGAVVVNVDDDDPPGPTNGDPVALEWPDEMSIAEALVLAPSPYAVLLLPPE